MGVTLPEAKWRQVPQVPASTRAGDGRRGGQACIGRILADDQLEAIQTRIDARVDFDADTLNPPTGVTPD